jgi:hypothetical protein
MLHALVPSTYTEANGNQRESIWIVQRCNELR